MECLRISVSRQVWFYYLLGKCFGSIGFFVCLSVSQFVCKQHCSNSYDWIAMNIKYGGVGGSTKFHDVNSFSTVSFSFQVIADAVSEKDLVEGPISKAFQLHDE